MIISDKKSLNEIQQEFNKLFGHLALKFYKSAHNPSEGSSAKEEWTTDLMVGEIRSIKDSGELKISKEMSVKDLEEKFENTFGLHVQVFRESTAGIWLQTTATDDWSLEAQNDRAKAILDY